MYRLSAKVSWANISGTKIKKVQNIEYLQYNVRVNFVKIYVITVGTIFTFESTKIKVIIALLKF